MKKLGFILGLLFSTFCLAEEVLDVRFLMTQRSAGNPYALPIRISPDGSMSILSSNGNQDLVFRPTIQTGFSRAVINYSQPVILNRFNFYPQQKDLGWVEVKRLKLEGGVGLSSIMKQMMTVGLIPYKGSIHTIIRHKKSREDKSLPFRMPRIFAELEEWNVNDIGTFQTYGGISVYAGVNYGIVDFALGSIGLQNQFIVEMKKVSKDIIKLTITEEDLKRRQIVIGPTVMDATFAQFKGQRFSSEFTLNLNLREHHELFEEALNGNIKVLQERLDHESQKLSWIGNDRSFYIGIPVIGGKMRDRGHYDLNEDGVETELDFTGSRTKGTFTPLRNLQDFVYQTDEAMVIAWTSEMNRTDKKAFEKRFLSIGRTIGIKGFNREAPDAKFGSVVSQVAVHMTKREFEAVSDMDMETVKVHLKNKCESEELSCRKESKLRNIITRLNQFRQKPWKEIRGDLGLLLIKEPAIIYAIVRTMKYKKEAYYKFLSERYQSLEGSALIESN